ncbi:tctex1 domain-containing protein 1-B [Biomphalaria glabrata]|uniref:Dynein light chain Tctex-type 5-B-like n=1 Tax=Biomphalaria glabrata TaxID=6526 RepID=A0A2C9K615_BIOGL|nr:dynein light chain Tctex-type 5-B-like [Biomphalaria glabrata]XP_055886954.1 dynein light chain Tctex-type 5-B-like [Biomphalaria glabrata]KAI8750138.1 tctex1 domain-containing protein 1-B-like [Biomphalaria glabrata]KAI8787415.1 tctex1 domain-containing protein 1-B [Biomphalaria glabrata]
MNNRKNSVVTSNKMTVLDGGSSTTNRSAMIITSAQTVRETPAPSQFKQYENTYQLGPTKVTSSSKLEKIIDETLKEHLTGRTYTNDSSRYVKLIADQLKQKAKELGVPRYKYVCTVALGPTRSSTLSMASRCVWDPNVDTFAENSYEKDGLFATAVIYCIYTE